LSFFDDGEETASHAPVTTAGADATRPRAPRRRAPAGGGPGPVDHRTLMIRRAGAAGAALVLVILIVLFVSGCLKSEKQESLKTYNHDVNTLAAEYDEQVTKPLFTELASASGKSALDVEEQVNQLRIAAQGVDTKAQGLSVPGEMEAAQHDVLVVYDLRLEAMNKLAALLPTALGGKNARAVAQVAGAMEAFLASDVIYSQRVVPLVQQTLLANGITGLTTNGSRSLPNIGWLEASTVGSRLAGQSSSSSSTTVTGNHGSALVGTSVGSNALAAEPTLNHVTGTAGNPTFTLGVENSGEFPETNVKVDVTVTAGGKQVKGQGTVEKTEPGKTVNQEVQVKGVPTGVAAKVEVFIEGVPGENDLENNKGSYLAIFE